MLIVCDIVKFSLRHILYTLFYDNITVFLLPIIAETMKNKKSSSMLIFLKFSMHEGKV